MYTPQADRDEESPPIHPPVMTPTKGRNYVQASDSGPSFLNPFNSERAIEPTGPEDSLTTIKTQPYDYGQHPADSTSSEDPPTAPSPREGDVENQDAQSQADEESNVSNSAPRLEYRLMQSRVTM